MLAVAIVFGQTLGHPFTGYDDSQFVYDNPHVASGVTWSGLRWVLTDGPFGEWTPLSTFSQMLDCQLYGLEPAGHYLTNLLLHAAASVLLFWVMLRMTSQRAVPTVAEASGARAASAGPSATNQRAVPTVAEASGARAALAGPSATNQRAVPTVAEASGARAALAGPGNKPASDAHSGRSERREAAQRAATNTAIWPSAWVAAVFAVHPLHVESVAWLAERRDVLSGLFFMLTLGAYVLYVERPSLARYLAVAGLFALGLMAKPMLVTVPFVLLLLDYWPLNRFRPAAAANSHVESPAWLARLPIFWRLTVEKLPLVALAAADCAIVLATHMSFRLQGAAAPLSLATRLANAVTACAAYFLQSFIPVDISPYYPHLGANQPVASVAGAVLLLLAMTTVAVLVRRQLPCLLVGWLWFLGMLVPVVGLVGNFLHARADRYTYLSQIGLSIALAWGVWTAYQSRQAAHAARWRQNLLAVASSAAILLLAAVAGQQTSYWRNRETLWRHALDCDQQNLVAHYSLAMAYVEQGRIDEAVAQLREGLAVESTAIGIQSLAHTLLAQCLTQQGMPEEALEQFAEASRVLPTDGPPHGRLAAALGRAGMRERAVAEWREAVRIEPLVLGARLGLADALLADGKAAEAVVQANELLRQAPDAIDGIVTLGVALAANGQSSEAIDQLQRALNLAPGNAQVHFRLGLVLRDCGRLPGAVSHLNQAVRLEPNNIAMLWQTAWLLATSPDSLTRNGKQAVDLARRATELSGGQEPYALDALAAALAETKQFTAAMETARRGSQAARDRGNPGLAAAIEKRARLYQQELPYREPAK